MEVILLQIITLYTIIAVGLIILHVTPIRKKTSNGLFLKTNYSTFT